MARMVNVSEVMNAVARTKAWTLGGSRMERSAAVAHKRWYEHPVAVPSLERAWLVGCEAP